MVVGQVDPTLCKEYKGSILSELSTPGAFGFHMSLKTLEDIEEPISLSRGTPEGGTDSDLRAPVGP